MKTIICSKYGSADVLQLHEVDKPTPNVNEVLVKIQASSATAADVMMREGSPTYGRLFLGLFKPKITTPGTGFSGTIESIGGDVKMFMVGDDVFGEVLLGAGSNAEYVCVSQNELLFIKPDNISHSKAASLGDGAVTSMNFLHNLAKVKPGQRVLINGASGSLGTAAVQIAKQQGAHVTGLCSATNIALVKSLGADAVIDYTKESMMDELQHYDVIYDTVGKLSFSSYKKFLTESGAFISPVLSLGLLGQVLLTSLIGSKKAVFSATGLLPTIEAQKLFLKVRKMVSEGSLLPVLDREFSLDQIADAHRYIETGRKVGNLALVIE
jgi:NADPH:quinone reductase-like Zn-dependent oxidoreductase